MQTIEWANRNIIIQFFPFLFSLNLPCLLSSYIWLWYKLSPIRFEEQMLTVFICSRASISSSIKHIGESSSWRHTTTVLYHPLEGEKSQPFWNCIPLIYDELIRNHEFQNIGNVYFHESRVRLGYYCNNFISSVWQIWSSGSLFSVVAFLISFWWLRL